MDCLALFVDCHGLLPNWRGLLWRCFAIVVALTVDWTWIDRGWHWWLVALTMVLNAYWPWFLSLFSPLT